MENVVPGTLQRLRAADIIRMAGLAAASVGQEYCRTGVVHSMQRQGARLSGVVEVLHTAVPAEETGRRRYPVEVEIRSTSAWDSACPCGQNVPALCAHGAALLYQWLARPTSFLVASSPGPPQEEPISQHKQAAEQDTSIATTHTPAASRPLGVQRGPTPLGSLLDILTQSGLSELRSIAREYEIATNGLNKQQLAEAIEQALSQPELVRRVAGTLEKAQRQLLAALTLAGGSMTDDDLRGLFERFALGQPNQLQSTLLALQGKAMLFRTSLNSSPQQRIGLSGSLLDIGWYVPVEVRSALRVSVPITPFTMQVDEKSGEMPRIEQNGSDSLLTDLLLVARSLDSYQLTREDEWFELGAAGRAADAPAYTRISGALSTDGSVPIPPPTDM
ncbi:MAG TPA: Rho termination factor N-terminal domain-containing protein, partial [Ktedonobacteraceae bacterium]|nr:Rho termination factor N-terminal domain-containing protein [Ktedonobacteraceae bacterium]